MCKWGQFRVFFIQNCAFVCQQTPFVFCSPEPLGSQGELILYPSSRRPSVRRLSASSVVHNAQRSSSPICQLVTLTKMAAMPIYCKNPLKIFFSETAGPIKVKFYVEAPWAWVGGTIFCSRHLGHMTKMAATNIYGKNPSKIFFSRTGGPIFTKLSM